MGDVIVGVNGHTLTDPNQLTDVIKRSAGHAGAPRRSTRDGRTRTVTGHPGGRPLTADGNRGLGPDRGGQTVGLIGVERHRVAPSAPRDPSAGCGTAVIDVGRDTRRRHRSRPRASRPPGILATSTR